MTENQKLLMELNVRIQKGELTDEEALDCWVCANKERIIEAREVIPHMYKRLVRALSSTH